MHKDMHCQAGDSVAVSLATLIDAVNCTHRLKSRHSPVRGLDTPGIPLRGGRAEFPADRVRDGDFACANGEWRMGDAGSDVLWGEADSDTLYADAEIDEAQLYEQGETQSATGTRGDWLDGGAGDDVPVGDDGDDVLLGDAGSDILYGGAGDDILLSYLGGSVVSADRSAELTRDPDTQTVTGWHFENAVAITVASTADETEAMYGGAGSDILVGTNVDDRFTSGAGRDGTDELVGDTTNLDAQYHGNEPADSNDALGAWQIKSQCWRDGEAESPADRVRDGDPSNQASWRKAA